MTKRKKIILTSVFILLTIINGLLLEQLTNTGIKGHMLLIGRSFFALLISMSAAAFFRKNVFPQKISTQLVRLVFSGAGLLLLTESYRFISASSVASIQRSDIPIIILISLIIGRKISIMQILLVIAAAVLIACLIIFSGSLNENPLGYYLALAGVCSIAISNFFVKRTAMSENFFVFVNTACISCLIIGSIVGLFRGFNFSATPIQLIEIFCLGICMFGLYMTLMEFYKHYAIDQAQYPAMLASFLIMCSEMIIQQKWFSPIFIVLNILLLVTITLTVRRRREDDKT